MPEINARARDTDSTSQTRATVEKKALKPARLLPKNTQQLVILGVAVVMVLIMWLTGNGKRPTAATAGTPTPRVQAADPATVQDFKQSIQKDQAAMRQPISQADLDGSRHWAWPTGFLREPCYLRMEHHPLSPRSPVQPLKIKHRHHPIP